LVDEAEEHALPAIPGQQPINQFAAGANDLARLPRLSAPLIGAMPADFSSPKWLAF
jgi:hypothetical protein